LGKFRKFGKNSILLNKLKEFSEKKLKEFSEKLKDFFLKKLKFSPT